MNTQALRRVIVWGLFLVPFVPLLISSELFFPFISTKAFAWRIIIEIVFAAWLILAFVDANFRPRKSLLLLNVAIFLVVIGLANVFGVAPFKSFWSNFERMEGFISLVHLGMFFVVISSVFDDKKWKQWWNTSLIVSFIMVCYCVLQLLGLKTINQGGVRLDGTFGNAIYLAVYMLFHMFIATLFLWREWRNHALRWVYGILILLQGVILYFTATRGAILGLMGGLIVVAVLNLRNKESILIKRASIALIISLVVLVSGFFLVRNSEFVRQNPVLSRFVFSTEELKYQGRYYVWPMAIEGFKERPILGWGQENFTYVFQKNYRPDMYRLEPWFDRAHNIFLDWLVVGGVVGLVSYLALYFVLLYTIWSRIASFSYTDKTIITGLVSAYFFHNFFVFDHLISYILFFSLLAHAHSLSAGQIIWNKIFSPIAIKVSSLAVLVLVVGILYQINFKPLTTNLALIEGLKAMQLSDFSSAGENFQKAYVSSDLGKVEVLEQVAANSRAILSSNITVEEKNKFFTFAKDAIITKALSDDFKSDARYQLMTGSFLSSVDLVDEALVYFNNARTLMPNKQQIYFEIGSAYINNNQNSEALDILEQAYELEPNYVEAKTAYLTGAIFAGDVNLENELIGSIPESDLIFSDQIINAYYSKGRIQKVISILNERIRLDPANKETYQQLIDSLAN